MKLKSWLGAFILYCCIAKSALAVCTIETAQKKMLEVTNMMQVYNKQQLDYLESQNSLPTEFEQRFSEFVNRSNALGIEFANQQENQTNLRVSDPVDESICEGYQKLFDDYAPEGYKKEQVKLQQSSSTDPNCSSEKLWARYAELVPIQNELTSAGKFTQDEVYDLQRLNGDIAQAGTTDINKACSLLDQLQSTLKSKL